MRLEDVFNTEEIIIENKKTKKQESKIVYSPKYKSDTEEYILSPFSNKYMKATPEQIVKYKFVCTLINDYGYSLEQMTDEVPLTQASRGTGRASADLLVWKNKKEKDGNKTAFLVIELKASNINLKVEDCYQGYNYATWSRAKLFAITNGKELQVYKTVEDELPLKLQPVNNIPQANDILDNKKLEELLSKTKEFTGDEFAKLLHKCHNIIRNNDKLSPEASFDEISKILFIKIMYENQPSQEAIFSFKQFEILKNEYLQNFKKEIENQIIWEEKNKLKLIKSGDFSEAEKIDEKINRLKEQEAPSYIQEQFNKVKEEYVTDNIFDENEKIKLREKSFEQIVKELEIYNLTSTSADVKGIAFEKFLGRTFRGELGQFFTPRAVVDFIVELLDPQEDELICDPCAGSGGFLIKSFETVKSKIESEYIEIKKDKQEEIFGKDLENIEDKGLQKQYDEFLSKINEKQQKKIEKLSKKSIFGTDANPRMARVSKMNMIMHGDGHNGIHHNDGLLNVNGIFRDRFDLIVTNPPFGTNLDKKFPIVEEDDKYKNQVMINKYIKEYGDKYTIEMEQVTKNIDKPIRGLFEVGSTSGATEVLFIERCLDLLKAGGRMGIVLPEGVLNSSNLQKARELFESRAKIILIVSLPQDIFVSSGATVKTSLVFFKKFTEEESKEYESIKAIVTQKINSKYEDEISVIDAQLKLRGKDALPAEEKKILRAKLKDLKIKVEEEINIKVKEKFDYEIPISDIKKAGITSTGAKGENQLPELLKVYTKYRKENKLWEEK